MAISFLKNKPWYKHKRIYLLLFFVGIYFIHEFLELRDTEEEIIDAFALVAKDYQVSVKYDTIQSKPMRYLTISDQKVATIKISQNIKPLIVFIHGAPSSLTFWKVLLKDKMLLKKADLLSIDRPGYGFSDYGTTILPVKDQANILATLIEKVKKESQKVILVGSSYGGTICARIAMDFPRLAKGVLFLSSSLSPGKETIFWMTYPTNHWSLKWIIPGAIQRANEEKLYHFEELSKMKQHWSNIIANCTILHGDQDNLIWLENAYFAQRELVNAATVKLVIKEGRGHDFIWYGVDYIKKEIDGLLTKVENDDRLKIN